MSAALTTTPARLTAADVGIALRDDRHMGWGLAVCEDLPERERTRLIRIIAEVANEVGLDYELLFLFANSKPARHLVDEFHGQRKDAQEFRRTVRRYLNPDMMALLIEDERKG